MGWEGAVVVVGSLVVVARLFWRFVLLPINEETREAERRRDAVYAALPQHEKDRINADRIIQYNRTGK